MTAWRVIPPSRYGAESSRILLNCNEVPLYADRLYFCVHTIHVHPTCLPILSGVTREELHSIRVLSTSANIALVVYTPDSFITLNFRTRCCLFLIFMKLQGQLHLYHSTV
jgi:hypothetical protein